jgi:spore coat protein U-like protein
MQSGSLFMHAKFLAGTAALAAALTATPALAQNATGTIAVALTVSNACLVNGSNAPASDLGTVGNIRFPDQPGIFGDIDAQLAVAGGGALSVQCSPNATPTITVGGGANESDGTRHMAMGGRTVAYRLYADQQRQDEITPGETLALGTAGATAISVPIYARVNSNGQLLAAGTYRDTVQVTLSW